MAQLVAIVQGGTTQYELDVPNIPIELNFQFQDLNDPLASKSPYTFNFKLPMTRTNIKFFSYYHDFNVSLGSFQPTVRTKVQLYDEGILIMEGTLQLYAASDNEFTVNIVEQLADLFEQIRDLSWEELFTSDAGVDTDLDHALNWSNIISSWTTTNDVTTGGVGAGTIVYPLSDWGQNSTNNQNQEGIGMGFVYGVNGVGMGTSGGQAPLAAKNFKPAIRIQYLIEYIFQYAGLVYNSAFLDAADFRKIYMFLATETERAVSRASYGFRVGLSSSLAIPASSAGIYQTLAFTDESSSPFFDPDGLINAAGAFIVPYDGNYYLTSRLICSVPTVTSASNYSVQARFLVNGQPTSGTNLTQCTPLETCLADFTALLELSAGDVVTVQALHNNTFDGVTFSNTDSSGVSLFALTTYTGTAGFVDVSANFPDVSVDEWLRAICEKFNLIMVTKRTDPGVVFIEPWNVYWETGTTRKDFTDKIDADSIVIEPTTKYQKKVYKFQDAEGKDFVNQWFQAHYRKVYGRYYYENDNDFATDTQESSEVFQPLRLRPIYSNIQNTPPSLIPNVLCPVFWDWHDGSNGSIYLKQFVECKPVLAYYNGLQDIGNGGQFNYGGTLYDNYPYFAEYNTVGVTTTTNSLQWGYSYPDNLYAPFVSNGNTPGITTNYLFNTYWLRMMNELFSRSSRLMSCKLNLTTTDLYKLEFNDLIFIEGSYWRVLSISNFALNQERLCNAELIKVIDAPKSVKLKECNQSVSSFNVDGTVNFVNTETGSSATPTERCCIANGFLWDNTRSVCFYLTGTDTTSPNPNAPSGKSQPLPSRSTAASSAVPVAVQSESFVFGNIIGGDYTLRMFATTTSATAVNAQSDQGETNIPVPPDTIAYVSYDVTMVHVGGSAANVGEASNFTARVSVANTRDAAANAPTLRTVGGAPTIVNTQKDSGVTASTGVTTIQRAAGADANFTITCTGEADVKAQWLLEVKVQYVEISGLDVITDSAAYFNLTGSVKIHLNLSNNETLDFNL